MSSLAPFYRTYELPWSPKEEVEQGFRKVARYCFIVFFVLVVLIQLLPLPDAHKNAPALPDRVVNLVLEQRKPPPPPPKVIEPEKPKEVPKPKPEVKPEPVPEKKVEEARKQAAKAMAVFDELNALRDNNVVNKAQQNDRLLGAVSETRSERSMITSNTGRGSGGINNSTLSRGYGGSAGELAGHNTAAVTSNLGVAGPRGGDVQKGAGSRKGSRSGEEIAQVFDANRSGIDALYARAVRERPDLQGKVIVKLTILPDGSVEACSIDSSTLGDEEFERKLLARIKLFRFPTSDVQTITVTKPLDFFPAG